MGKVISIISQKGGVGKSTVTTLLANIFYFKYNISICVLDIDFPQYSIAKRRDKELAMIQSNERMGKLFKSIYGEDRLPYKILRVDMEDTKEVIAELKEDYDLIFVDAPGTVNQLGYVEFLSEINYFLIPCLQDDFSMHSTFEFYHMLKLKVKDQSEAFEECKLFFNRVPAQNKLNAIIPSMIKSNMNLLGMHFRAYADYERIFRSTLFPIPYKPNLKSSVHIYEFAKHVLDTFNIIISKEVAYV